MRAFISALSTFVTWMGVATPTCRLHPQPVDSGLVGHLLPSQMPPRIGHTAREPSSVVGAFHRVIAVG